MTSWASGLGQVTLHQISQLYRALVWEGFILLAVAAGEDNSIKRVDSNATEKENMQGVESRETVVPHKPDTAVSMDVDIGESAATTSLNRETDQDQTIMETSDQQGPSDEPNSPAAVVSKLPPSPVSHSPQTQLTQHPSILVESLKQLTPLLTITSRVGRSLAELMSLLIRLSTSPLHRIHRRGAGHAPISHYQEPAKEAISVCMEVTNLLVDSLKWEVPMPEACSSAMQSPIRDWLFAG